MEIILLEKIANLGNLGDVVKVKNGFARNYLIPQGKATLATPDNLTRFEQRRAELEKAAAEALNNALARAEKLEGLTLQISRKAGADGRLFGSVTNLDILEELAKQGYEVHRSELRNPHGPMKQVGDYPVDVSLHSDVTVRITVSVIGEA
jgi:large subunit ribosomal protein L9